jgi:glutamate formiminotransferase / 5-formyltetrahydrofolate cyclo-ligase
VIEPDRYSDPVADVYEAVPNFSEGRDASLVNALGAGNEVLDVHADASHHRCVVTLVTCDASALVKTLFQRIRLAAEKIDVRQHQGVHPRLGVADVVPIVPLGSASLSQAEAVARELAERVWRDLRIPVCYYGSLAKGRRLAEIRRGAVPPDLGSGAHPSAGICCIAARPPLVAWNLVLLLPWEMVQRVAAEVRQPGVQALAFQLSGGRVQLSLNLTRPFVTGVAQIYAEVRRLTGQRGQAELVGLCPAAAAGPGCDGGLLEARLAARAAREMANGASPELAGELQRLGARLKALPADQAGIRQGSDWTEEIGRHLDGTGLLSPCAASLLRVAASGFDLALREHGMTPANP